MSRNVSLDLKRLFPDFEPVTSSIAECLRFWADHQPLETAYIWYDGEENDTLLSYEDLDRRARAQGRYRKSA